MRVRSASAVRPCGLINCGESAEVLGIFVERDADAGRKSRGDGEGLIVLIGARVGEEQAAPAVERRGLDFDEELVDRGGGGVLLLPYVEAGETVEGRGVARIDGQRGAEFLVGDVELILAEGLRGLVHDEPEARVGERVFNDFCFVSVLFGLREVRDGGGEVLLAHAQEAHSGGGAAVGRIFLEERGEELIGLIEVSRVQSREGCTLGGSARDA